MQSTMHRIISHQEYIQIRYMLFLTLLARLQDRHILRFLILYFSQFHE